MPASAIAFRASFAMYSGPKGDRALLTWLKAEKQGCEHARLGCSTKKRSTDYGVVPSLPHLVEAAEIETVLLGKQIGLQRGQFCVPVNDYNSKNHNSLIP